MINSHLHRVSVIVPVYNAEAYLEECLDSIIASDMEGIEIIAVNDGSTDRSAEILAQYQSKYGIVVLSQKNGGVSKARNAGLDIATGDYIGFVDSDDWVEPNMYSRMYYTAVEHNADIVFCNLYRNANEKMRKYIPDGVYNRGKIEEIIYPILISNLDETAGQVTLRGSVCLRLFKKSLIELNCIRFCDGLIYNEDGLFCIQATLCAECYIYLGSDYLYHNRAVNNSTSRRYISGLWGKQQKLFPVLDQLTAAQKFDFSEQISKKTFEVGIYCVENECKIIGRTHNVKNIREILTSARVQNAIRGVNRSKFKNINLGYWWAFRLKSAILVRKIAHHRSKKQGRG